MSQFENPKQLVRDGYDKVSCAYRSDTQSAFDDSARKAWVNEMCAALPHGAKVLDLGCGCGLPVTRLLAQHGSVTGVDLSPVQIERAKRYVPEAAFRCADMSELRFDAETFDAIVAFYSIIHLPVAEQRPLLARIAKWLKPGGRFMASLGVKASTGTENDWLDVPGATMYWSHADAATYRAWLHEVGLTILAEDLVPEGDGGHTFFHACKEAEGDHAREKAVAAEVKEVSPDIVAALEAAMPEFDRPHTRDEIECRLAGRVSLLLAAFLDGRPVAYKVGYEDAPQRFYSWIGGVLPHYRRRGLAHLLMEHQERWCRQHGYREIAVHSENRYRAMLGLLVQSGYDIVGTDMNGKITFRKTLGER